MRLRTVDDRHFFALKQPTVNPQSCLEYETEVADREQMHQAILRMSFRPTVRVAKTRRSAQLGEAAVCVDELEGVGTFLELERMVRTEEEAAVVQAELAASVATLGVEVVRTEETYEALVRQHQSASI